MASTILQTPSSSHARGTQMGKLQCAIVALVGLCLFAELAESAPSKLLSSGDRRPETVGYAFNRQLAKMKKWYNDGNREFADGMALGADPYYTMKWSAVPAAAGYVPDKRMDDVMGLDLEPGRLEWNFNRL